MRSTPHLAAHQRGGGGDTACGEILCFTLLR